MEETLARIREAPAEVPGTLALGGSRARGSAPAGADIDIGLYYDPARAPDFDELLAAASRLDDRGAPDGFGRAGEWGPWINGGIWLRMGGVKVDVLLRDVDRVRRVIDDCAGGRPKIF